METHSHIHPQSGFTRIELAAVLAAVSLIGAMGLTVLGDNRERSERVVCANNLHQVGRAFHMWASDHGGENPFWTSYRDGGSLIRSGDPLPPGGVFTIPGVPGIWLASLRNTAWLQFAFINQELPAPAVLLCPSEQNRVRAQDFSSTPSKGYLSSNFRDRATSYIIGLHAMDQYPSSILSGDRTLREEGTDSSCNANVGVVSRISGTSGWLPFLHNGSGNVLLNDGRVEKLSTSGLVKFLQPPAPDAPAQGHHYIKPQ